MRNRSHIIVMNKFSKRFCCVCKKRLMVMAGTPIVMFFGWINDNEMKTQFGYDLRSHYHCFFERTHVKRMKVKKVFSYIDVEKIVKRDKR